MRESSINIVYPLDSTIVAFLLIEGVVKDEEDSIEENAENLTPPS